MARIFTGGFELNTRLSSRATDLDVHPLASVATIQSGTVRSGGFAGQVDSGAGNSSGTFTTTASSNGNMTTFSAGTYYFRWYFNFSQFPSADVYIVAFNSTNAGVKLTSGGNLQLFNNTVQVGSNSTALSTGTWYRIEVKLILSSATNATDMELLLDGATVASGAGLTVTIGSGQVVGWVSAPGANKVLFIDDVAVNNATGSDQNNYPGEGKVVLLKPTADSAGGAGWTLGGGTALGGNGFTAVSNTPPLGQGDLTGGADTKQIRNAAANVDDSYDATMTTYAAAGLVATDVIYALVPFVITASDVSTSAKLGTVGVVSNPTVANIALNSLIGTAGGFWSGAAASTFGTGWKGNLGTTTYRPSVTVGTAPVMRVTQSTASTRIAIVCFMGMYVDYAPPPLALAWVTA